MFLRTFISVLFVASATFCAPCLLEHEDVHGKSSFTEKQAQGCECACHESQPIHQDQEQTGLATFQNFSIATLSVKVQQIYTIETAKSSVHENALPVFLTHSALPNVLRI